MSSENLSPKPSRMPRIVLIVSIAVIALSLVVIGIFLPRGIAEKLPNLDPVSDESLAQAYGYDLVKQPNVPGNQTFKLEMAATFAYNDCRETTCWDYFQVFTDPGLTQEADFTTKVSWSDNHIPDGVLIGPPEQGTQAAKSCVVMGDGYCEVPFKAEEMFEELGEPGRWALSDKYYLVRRVDELGNRLDRPQVTLFTIANQAQPDAPSLDARPASDGSIDFSWSAVDGAEKYTVVLITRPRDRETAGAADVKYNVLGETDQTSLNSADATGERDYWAKADAFDSPRRQNQNIERAISLASDTMLESLVTEDEVFETEAEMGASSHITYIPSENGMPIVTFGVIARTADSASAIREISADQILAKTPTEIAAFGQKQFEDQRPCGQDGAGTRFGCLPQRTAMAITMADGRTVQRPVITDASVSKPCVSSRAPDCTTVLARAQGSAFTTDFDFEQAALDDASRQMIDEQNKTNLAAMPLTGGSDVPFEYASPDDVQIEAGDTISTAMPEVPYPVNGSIELVRFIAANVMAGNERMDVTRYVQDPAVDLDDAIAEALAQNPYTLLSGQTSAMTKVIGGHTILYVGLSVFSGLPQQTYEAYPQQREKLLDKVESVTSQIITDAMSDREKALAINQWIVDNGEYNYDALALMEQFESDPGSGNEVYLQYPTTSNALGILIDGTGVCASYAAAFKALADQAGLNAVYVTGVATSSGDGHAWVKAQIDGNWVMIDPTWDDGADPLAYFGLTDAQSSATRVQDSDWMMDAFIGQYAA